MKIPLMVNNTAPANSPPDTSFSLENIHFGFDSFEPSGEFTEQLLLIRQLLNNNSLLAVKVSGYTDRVGAEVYNKAAYKKSCLL